MSISRRGLLQAGTATAVTLTMSSLTTACGPSKPAAARPAPVAVPVVSLTGKTDLSTCTQAVFGAQVGSQFQLKTPSGFSTVQLYSVEDLSQGQPASSHPLGEVFSVVFVEPSGALLPQDVYALSHPVLGEFSLLLVPGRSHPEGQAYEALFNRRLG